MKDSFETFELDFDYLTSPALALDTFHSRARFCRDFVILSPYLRYPYLHDHKHKNTLSLAFMVSFWSENGK